MNSIPSVQWWHTKSALTSSLDFFLSSEVVTMWQTDGIAHKLKLRLFHKSTQLWVHLANFHLQCESHLTISHYIKNTDNMNLEDIQDSCLPQSKSYLKILGLSYLLENTNTSMDSGVIKNIIKTTHIFNNIKVASKRHVCKVSPKSDIAIIWINIWDS